MIQVLIREPERRFTRAVTFYQDDPITGKKQVWRLDEHGGHWEDVALNVDILPTLEIGAEFINALTDAWTRGRPAPSQDAVETLTSSLQDTRTTRDRLLGLVEAMVQKV